LNDFPAGTYVDIAYDPANPIKNVPIQSGVEPVWTIVVFSALIAAIGVFCLWAWILILWVVQYHRTLKLRRLAARM